MSSPHPSASPPNHDSADHVLSAYAGRAARAHGRLSALLDEASVADAVAQVPDQWLQLAPGGESPDALRAAYVTFLSARLDQPRAWLPQERAA